MAKLNTRNRNAGKVGKDGKAKPANWEYRFEGARINGKRQQFTKAGFRTKKEAEIAGTKALAEYNNVGKHFEPAEISVSDFFDYWRQNDLEVNLADNTSDSYSHIIDNHIKPALGIYKLKAIDTMALQEFVNAIATDYDFSKEYIKTIYKLLKQGFKYAQKKAKFIPVNPAEDITLPKIDEEKREMIILTKEQIADILDRFHRDSSRHQYMAILIAYYTGLRVSEVLGLSWDDIDLQNKTLTVNKAAKKFSYNSKQGGEHRGTRNHAKTKWYLGSCKTPNSYRTIAIGDTLVNALQDYKEWQEENEKECGEYYTHTYIVDELTKNKKKVKRIIPSCGTPDTFDLPEIKMVCVNESGQFSGTDIMKYPSSVINKKLGIRFNFHALRHTHATMLIEQGIPIKTVSERLGHSSTRITWDIYVNVTEKMEHDAVDKFEESSGLKFRDEELYALWKKALHMNNSYYNERNITTCEEWKDFKVFEKWALENGYTSGLRLIRINKSGNFEPGNCMWGTETKSVRGDYIYSDGTNIKSYSVRSCGRGWQYRITDYDIYGKRREISRAGFATENDAALAAEAVINDLFNAKQALKDEPKLRLVK